MICISCGKDVRPSGLHTCWDAGLRHTVWVSAPHFCCGIVFLSTRCIEAAPIMRWAVGKEWRTIRSYLNARRYEFRVARSG